MKRIILLLSIFMLFQQSVQAEWRFLFVFPDGFKLVWIPDSQQYSKEKLEQVPTRTTYTYRNCIRYGGGNACENIKKAGNNDIGNNTLRR